MGGGGGGVLYWEVAELMELDGSLSLRGTSGTGGNAGGGSGGALLLKTTNMTGHGLVAVDGGAGVGSGCGGSGGRVGIHCRWRYQFGGQFDNFGGDGGPSYTSTHAGASGTTYKQENMRELEYRLKKYDKVHNTTFLAVDHTYMHSDNAGKHSPAATLIMEDGRDDYELDELELTGTARLLLFHPKDVPRITITVHKFIGDRTGQLHLKTRQVAYVEVVESENDRTEAPCSYIIDDGAEIVLPSETHIHGTNSTLAGLITGVPYLFIEDGANIEFMSTGQTALLKNGTRVDMTQPGHFSFDTFTVKAGGSGQFTNITDLIYLQVSEIHVKYRGTLYMNHAEISSSFAWIESQGTFRLDGKGYAAEEGHGRGFTLNSIGYGAGHGGFGGVVSSETDAAGPHDSVYTPSDAGSGGGNGRGTGGAGGGKLLWRVGQNIEINGRLMLNGIDGSGTDAGGGSGGSVIVYTTDITGHGVIDVVGGSGTGKGTGGAGGRAAIHCRWRYWYGGQFKDRGGSGGSSWDLTRGAAAGTVYVENNFRPLEYRILKYMPGTNDTYFEVDHKYVHIDNENRKVPVATMVMEPQTTTYEFDEMELTGDSRLVFYHVPGSLVNVTVHRFIGDKTGRVHIRGHQKLFSEFVESISNVTEAPCSYVIESGAELLLPTEVRLHGTNTELDGMITGVHHLYIEAGSKVTVSSTAQTALMEDEEYVDVSTKGNISFATVNLRKDGLLQLRKIQSDLTMTTGFLEVKYKGLIQINHGYLDLGDADVETEGRIDLKGRGYTAGHGEGAGSSGCGGSYGGRAGGGGSGACPDLSHGSTFRPTDLGSGGSGSEGGSGGGHVNIRVGRMFSLDGLVTVAGSDATDGGGGSGGTLLIEAYNMSGHGVFDASGGSGRGDGGGGSGGRIAVHVTFSNLYGGSYVASGGQGGSTCSLPKCIGGPGTIYKYESNHGPQYRELKYNPRLNVTTVKPEHSKLTVDNRELITDNAAVIMETNTVYYEFDEVQVEGHSYVHFYHPNTTAIVNVVIHELTGNKRGLVRVQHRQRVIINFVESTHTYLDAPCGFHVDRGGVIVLPTKVVILAERVILEGRMTGVDELIIERQGEFVISGDAHTGSLPDLILWYVDNKDDQYTSGHVQLQILSIQNGGQLTSDMGSLKPVVDAGDIVVKAGGLLALHCPATQLNCTMLEVEKTGRIDGTGHGFPGGLGPGRGTAATLEASGGGHGGRGKKVAKLFILSNESYGFIS